MYDYVGAHNWRRISLYETATWKNGLAFKNIDFSKFGRPVIKIAELKNGVTSQTAHTLGQYDPSVLVQAGDMLLSWSGNPDTSIDVFRWDGPDGWLNQHIFKVIPLSGVSKDFLFFLLRWLKPRFTEIARNKQTTGLGHVTGQDLKRIIVGLPELQEQNFLTAIITPFQEKIELNRRMNETLDTMSRVIFKNWFIDFGPTRAKLEGRTPYLAPDLWALFPERFDDKGKPEGWSDSTLATYTSIQNGYAFKSSEWRSEGVPVVKIGSVKPAVVDLSQVSYISTELAAERATFRLNVGDILVGLTGYVGEVGRIPPTNNTPMLNQRVGRFVVKEHCGPFVYACARSPNFKGYAEAKAHGSAQPNVSTNDLLTFPIIGPPNRLVVAYKEAVEPLFNRYLATLSETTTLKNARELLLSKLMSGKIRIRDAEKIVEAVL